ncbi:helix-turn-helix domain-containing protein [Bacillus sp. MUM 13]|uniref:PucR family transcriptional regulator n=1 Tax=Bacillus sp. MUM 13 TaxID=1678001 RepID=UPI0008F5E5F1|nr:helix-turn-helix domain-containing protein [Bacillus sp. MUM 13]OIK09703.1 hypothetical protein BIV59_16435 [Bacillus sp. MUM 13]
MLDKLKVKYPNAVSGNEPRQSDGEFFWFRDSSGTFGIPKEEISSAEASLLQLLFPHNEEVFLSRNASEMKRQWSEFLYQNDRSLPVTSWKKVRFIHFSSPTSDFSYLDFEEAFTSLVSGDSLIVWEDENRGAIIEGESDSSLDDLDFFSIVQTLESDFYVKIQAFSGHYHLMDENLPTHFQMEQKSFELAKKHSLDTRMFTLPDVFPFAVLDGLAPEEFIWFCEELLGDAGKDEELIGTVKTYIECNSNASLAAKKLYIHRNSLQYRIDKFIEKTGLDIRTFHHALPAYLCLLKKEK